jgi:hypothetical protein
MRSVDAMLPASSRRSVLLARIQVLSLEQRVPRLGQRERFRKAPHARKQGPSHGFDRGPMPLHALA